MAKNDQYNISANVNTGYYYQWENFANYNRTFGKHDLGLMAGMSYIENNTDNASISAQDANLLKSYKPTFRYINYLLDAPKRTVGNAPGKSVNISYFGRLTYSYDNRYSLQANFRADAYDSSKLSKDVRWGYFPSVSAGWTVSNEPFFKDNVNTDLFNFLKFRASWGRNGNVNVLSGYPYEESISVGADWYQYGNDGAIVYGSSPSGLANPNRHWEISEQWDAGLDLRMFDNRLTFGFDWYRKYTKDLLIQIKPRPEQGVKNTYENAGNILNTGLEFELGWKDNIGDFRYSINANLATLHNEVTYLNAGMPRLETDPVSGLNEEERSSFEVGYPLWYFMGYKYLGVNPENGMPRYKTFNTGRYPDGVIEGSPEGDDLYNYLGKAIPDLTYGLTVNLAWRNFDFTMYGAGVSGNDIFTILWSADRTYGNTLSYFWKNSWTESNKNARLPYMKYVANDWKFWSSDAMIFSGSYFKIKQIQLGYTLPQNLTRKIAIDNLRLFVSLDDFFTITKYPGADPETATTGSAQAMGYDSGTYPTMKKAVFGVNITF